MPPSRDEATTIPTFETNQTEKDDTAEAKDSAEIVDGRNKSPVGCSLMVCLKRIRVEVVTFVYIFSFIIRTVSSTTMIMDKVCRVHKGFSDEICSNLTAYKAEKEEVETMANNYNLYHSLIEMAPSAILASFVGPWSDSYGRKLPICITFYGMIIDGLGTILCAYYSESRVEYYLIPPIFTALSGGFIGVFTLLYSYLVDITSKEHRTIKFAFMELGLGLGIPLGSLMGGYIYKSYGLVPVFATSVAGHIFGLFWVILILEETRGLDNKDSWKVKLGNFFCLDRLIESFRACTKPRPHSGRTQLWLLLFSMSFIVLSLVGTANIAYMFTYHHYDWDNPKYSTVSAVFSVFGMVAMLMAVPILTRCLKVGDPTLGILGSFSGVAKNIAISLSSKQGVYYLGNLLGLLSALSSLAGRSRISKLVSGSESGKVFAFLSTVESAVPIIATVAITQLFNATRDVFPDPSYLGIGCLTLFPLGVFIWMAFLPNVNYEEIKVTESSPEEKSTKIGDIC